MDYKGLDTELCTDECHLHTDVDEINSSNNHRNNLKLKKSNLLKSICQTFILKKNPT